MKAKAIAPSFPSGLEIRRNRPMVSSLTIAQLFGRRHDLVLRAIRKEVAADRLDYAFGGCPICGKPLLTNADETGPDIGGKETLSIERSDHGMCHSCKVFWHVSMGNFGATWGEEAARNIQKLEAMRRVEPWFPDREAAR